MWLDEARIWIHSPIARSKEERMRVYTTSTCILLLIKIKEQQPFCSLSIFQHVTPTHMHKSCIMIINLLFLVVLSNVYNLLHPNSLIYNKVHPQTLWKPSLDSLIHIQKTDHWNGQRKRLFKALLKTDIKETNKNRHRQKLVQNNTISHNTNHDNIECQNIESIEIEMIITL